MTAAIVEQYVQDHFFPSSSQMVAVHALWDERYRVNIWDSDPVNRITSSYFIKVNNGKAINATIEAPKILTLVA